MPCHMPCCAVCHALPCLAICWKVYRPRFGSPHYSFVSPLVFGEIIKSRNKVILKPWRRRINNIFPRNMPFRVSWSNSSFSQKHVVSNALSFFTRSSFNVQKQHLETVSQKWHKRGLCCEMWLGLWQFSIQPTVYSRTKVIYWYL